MAQGAATDVWSVHSSPHSTQIWVYGVSYVRDGCCVTKRLAEYDGSNPAGRTALKEMCLRLLLLVKANLDVIDKADFYPGKLRFGRMTKDVKNGTPFSPTNEGSSGRTGAVGFLEWR
jgi:hypothetical protein